MKTNEAADWDLQLLPLELAALRDSDVDLGLLGLSVEEFNKIMGLEPSEGLCDPDDVPLNADQFAEGCREAQESSAGTPRN